jgi:hypothetical protein
MLKKNIDSIKQENQTILKSFLNVGSNAKKMNVSFLKKGKEKKKQIKNGVESLSIFFFFLKKYH